MNLTKTLKGDTLTISLDGRLDTLTSPQLEAEIARLPEIRRLIVDLSNLTYISSAGLRALLAAQKKMVALGDMTLKGVQPQVMEVMEMTGFTEIMNFS